MVSQPPHPPNGAEINEDGSEEPKVMKYFGEVRGRQERIIIEGKSQSPNFGTFHCCLFNCLIEI